MLSWCFLFHTSLHYPLISILVDPLHRFSFSIQTIVLWSSIWCILQRESSTRSSMDRDTANSYSSFRRGDRNSNLKQLSQALKVHVFQLWKWLFLASVWKSCHQTWHGSLPLQLPQLSLKWDSPSDFFQCLRCWGEPPKIRMKMKEEKKGPLGGDEETRFARRWIHSSQRMKDISSPLSAAVARIYWPNSNQSCLDYRIAINTSRSARILKAEVRRVSSAFFT